MPKDTSEYLDLLQNIFLEMNIQNQRICSPYIFDTSTRNPMDSVIYADSEDWASVISAQEHELFFNNKCLLIRNSFHCDYLILPIPSSSLKSVLLVGPFLMDELSRNDILQLCSRLSIPEIHYDFLCQYYNMIPVIRDMNCLKSILTCFGNKIYEEDQFQIKRIYLPGRNRKALNFDTEMTCSSDQSTTTTIEERYKQESKVMSAIAAGDYNRAREAFHTFKKFRMEKRVSDSIRNQKNYMIILNTICRKSAELGNVHPVYLDSLSSKLAVKIESQYTQKQLNELESEMIHKYCLLVKNHSTKGHSPIISDIINYISMNLSGDLKLSHTAELFSISHSYLSTLFKKECGVPYNTYVTNRRMEYAISLLNMQKSSIQDIAAQCGIPDLTYFTKLFKSRYGMTPSEYRKSLL